MDKQEQKKILIDMMKSDEELGLYDDIEINRIELVCKDCSDSLEDCTCIKNTIEFLKEEPNIISDWLEQNRNPEIDKQVEKELEYLSKQEIKLEEVFNDDKKENIKKFIDEIKNPSEPNQALKDAAERLKGKELFKESNDRARKILSEIKSLPIQERYEKYSERFDNDESAIGNPETWGKRVLTEEDIFNQRDIDAVTDYIGKETSKQETLEEAAEIVLCAAIWLQEVERAAHRPINTPGGVVISGFRHGNCISSIVALTGKRLHEHGEHVQGFLTNKNRFVDRKEGAEIWIKNGGKLNYNSIELYSEDLY